MNQEDKQTKYIPFKGWVTIYNFKYKFQGLEYLVCDKYGNFYNLPHCKNKRTSNFKKLNSKKGYIYYQRIKYYLANLKNRVIHQKTNQLIFNQ